MTLGILCLFLELRLFQKLRTSGGSVSAILFCGPREFFFLLVSSELLEGSKDQKKCKEIIYEGSGNDTNSGRKWTSACNINSRNSPGLKVSNISIVIKTSQFRTREEFVRQSKLCFYTLRRNRVQHGLKQIESFRVSIDWSLLSA